MYQGETQIGKINSCVLGDSRFYFINRGSEKGSDVFEVLFYEENEAGINLIINYR